MRKHTTIHILGLVLMKKVVMTQEDKYRFLIRYQFLTTKEGRRGRKKKHHVKTHQVNLEAENELELHHRIVIK